MKTISKMLSGSGNKNNAKDTFRLRTVPDNEGLGQPAANRETPKDDRIDAARLERAWRRVPVIHNGINKMTQMIMSKEWEIDGPNEEFFEDFLEQVGQVGANQDFNEMLEAIFRYQMIYGEHYIELVEAQEDGSIVDLTMIDPKRMDYAKRGDNTIAMDRFGNPIGYIQELPFGFKQRGVDQVHEIPENVTLNNRRQIFFPNNRISHFKLYTYGEGFYPVGLIEPSFEASERSYQLQQDFADKAHNSLFPLRYAKVGDEMHEPTPDQTDEVLKQLREANSKSEGALPYYVDLEMLEADNPDAMLNFFDHFDEEMVKSLGIPKSIAQGEATRVNRASLQSQIRVWEVSMMDIIERTTNTIEKQIFEPIAEEEGFDEYPSFKFKFEVDPRHQIERATRFRGDVSAEGAPTMGGPQGGEGAFPNPGDENEVRSIVVDAMEAGIDPADLGIMPDDLGFDADSWDEIDQEEVEDGEQ